MIIYMMDTLQYFVNSNYMSVDEVESLMQSGEIIDNKYLKITNDLSKN